MRKGHFMGHTISQNMGFIRGEDGTSYFFVRDWIDPVMYERYKDPMRKVSRFKGEVEFTPERPMPGDIAAGHYNWKAKNIRWDPPAQCKVMCEECGYPMSMKWNYCPRCGKKASNEECLTSEK